MIQGTNLPSKDPLQFDETGDRNIILRLMVYLHNFHSAVISINQIMNSFTDNIYILVIGRLSRPPIECYLIYINYYEVLIVDDYISRLNRLLF